MMYLNLRNGLNSKPLLIPDTEDLSKHLNRTTDWYKSLYKYNEEQKKQIEETGTVSGIRDTLTNVLFFDFDSKDDVEKARQDAIETANRLVQRGFDEDSIGVYFTGSKGFSLELEMNEYVTPDKFKAIVFDIAGDLSSFDRVVNDPNRIVRIPNTKHNKSGLYKIPLTPEELIEISIDDIRLMAKNARKAERMLKITDLPAAVKDIKPPVEKSVESISKELTFDITTVDMKNRLPKIDEARHLLLNGFFKSGERNYAMLCIASTLKNIGYSYEHTEGMMKATADLQSSRTKEDVFPDKEIDLILKQVYSDRWQGGQFTTRDPNNWLAQYVKRMGINVKEDEGPATLDLVGGGFASYIKNMKANTIKTGIPELDKSMPITLGSNIGIVAAAGAGKTSLALKILKNTSEQGIQTVFASLDMSRNRLFEKVVYNLTGLSREEVYLEFTEGRGQKIIDMVKKHYGNVWFYDRSSATVEDVKNYILQVESKTGEKVKMVMFDYFERISCETSDETAASKKVAGQIQDLVNDLDIASICLTQPNKFSLGGGPDTELTSYTSIKGSSFLYQSFRGIISLSRPFYTPATKELDKYCILSLLKNDLGQQDRFELGWDGKTGDIYTLEDHEKDELRELMKMKDAVKNGKDGWE